MNDKWIEFAIRKLDFMEAFMYERMLNKQETPSFAEMTEYCGNQADGFSSLHEWLIDAFQTEPKVVFPYGNHYGWGIGHYKKKKLMCNIFAENGAFTVMVRLTNAQFDTIYDRVTQYTQEVIDKKYPCGNGGWIQYRVACPEEFEDIKTILELKCS